MGGSQAIPTVPDVISPDGFGVPTPLVLTLDALKEALHYRANLALDVINSTTSPGGEVVLYLDVSIDGGTTYTNRAKNAHVINSTCQESTEARPASAVLPRPSSARSASVTPHGRQTSSCGRGRIRCSVRAALR
jgi:hypothetical protein